MEHLWLLEQEFGVKVWYKLWTENQLSWIWMNTLYPGFKDIIQIDVFEFYTSITTMVKQCIDYKKVVHESIHWQKFICFLMWPYLCTWTLITVNKILFTMLSCLFFFFCYYCKFLFPGLIFSIQYSTVHFLHYK